LLSIYQFFLKCSVEAFFTDICYMSIKIQFKIYCDSQKFYLIFAFYYIAIKIKRDIFIFSIFSNCYRLKFVWICFYLVFCKGTTISLEGGLCFFSKKNILIPNVAEKNILILVEEKKSNWFRVLSYNLMLNSGRKISYFARQKK
jgi:hypothetical protein